MMQAAGSTSSCSAHLPHRAGPMGIGIRAGAGAEDRKRQSLRSPVRAECALADMPRWSPGCSVAAATGARLET